MPFSACRPQTSPGLHGHEKSSDNSLPTFFLNYFQLSLKINSVEIVLFTSRIRLFNDLGADRLRTGDLRLAKPALFRLSYSPAA